jgi:hypothetical protein
MSWAYSTYRDRRGTYRVLVGKPGGRIPRGRPRCREEDNIKMDLQEWTWTRLLWLKIVGACACGNKNSSSIKCGEFLYQLRTVSFSRRTLLVGVS